MADVDRPEPIWRPDQFWELLDQRQRRLLEEAGERHAHPVGTMLLSEGAPAESVLVLIAGRVKVIAVGRGGGRCLLAIRGPGDVLGEMAAVDERRRSASVVAVEPIEVLRLPVPIFQAILGSVPGIAYVLLRVVSTKLRAANRRRVQASELTVYERVQVALMDLAAEHGSHQDGCIRITVPLSQQEIADMVGGSREAVVRALRRLRNDGDIRTNRRQIVVIRPLELAARAGRQA